MSMFEKKLESFGEQVITAAIASLDGTVDDINKGEIIIENMLSPDLSLRDVAAICAVALGSKAMLWPNTHVYDVKNEFEKQWSHFVTGDCVCRRR